MKLSTLVCASAFYATATAWRVQFHTRNNTSLTMYGTTGAACITTGWSSGRNKEDVDYINFDPATDSWPDPSKVTVYAGLRCGSNGVSFSSGIHKPEKGCWVGSFVVE